MEKTERKVKNILKRAGIELSNSEFRTVLKEYNNFRYPISTCLMHIITSPKEFIDFLKARDL